MLYLSGHNQFIVHNHFFLFQIRNIHLRDIHHNIHFCLLIQLLFNASQNEVYQCFSFVRWKIIETVSLFGVC